MGIDILIQKEGIKMSFKNIKEAQLNNIYDRTCVMVINLTNKEQLLVKNICSLMGIKDLIVLDYRNSLNIVKDILDGNNEYTTEEGLKNKAILFNNLDHAKINSLLENLKKVKINNILSAIVTETSINWTIDNLLKNLIDERKAMKSGKVANHK